MYLYIGTGVLFLSFLILKFYQFKSLKYFKDQYKTIKPYFLFHGVYYQDKYYSDKKGIKYRNIGAVVFIIGTLFGVAAICVHFMYYN